MGEALLCLPSLTLGLLIGLGLGIGLTTMAFAYVLWPPSRWPVSLTACYALVPARLRRRLGVVRCLPVALRLGYTFVRNCRFCPARWRLARR